MSGERGGFYKTRRNWEKLREARKDLSGEGSSKVYIHHLENMVKYGASLQYGRVGYLPPEDLAEDAQPLPAIVAEWVAMQEEL